MPPKSLPAPSRRAILLGAASLLPPTSLAASPAPPPPQVKARTIRAVMHATLGLLDPFAITTYITRNYGYLVYDTLFALDAENRPQPQMVGAWTVSDDRLTYLFTLRPGLLFHDGTPVTATDVVASLRRWMPRDPLGMRLASLTETLDAPLDPPGDTRFRLVLKRPFAMVLESLAKPSGAVPFILPRHLVERTGPLHPTEVVGSGPFRFVGAEYRPGDRVVYERFDGYVPRPEPPSGLAGGKVVKVDRVEWLEITDPETGVAALLSGEVQVVENIPADMMPLLRRTPGIVLKPRSFGNSLLLRLNCAQAPFDNPGVRRAVLTAVSQPDYLAAQIGDEALFTPCNSVLSCDSPWLADIPGPAADPARARALLRDSGYAGELAVLMHPADQPAVSSVMPLTEQVLRGIGMNVRLDAMDYYRLLGRRTRNVPVADGGWSMIPAVLSNLDLMNPLINPYLDGSGPRGFIGWGTDPEMDRLHDAFAAETGPAGQQATATALQRLSNLDAFTIPLGGHKVVTGTRAEVKGVIADQILVFWNMEIS